MKRITTIAVLILIINISFAQHNETYLDINQVNVKGITYKTPISEMKKILGKPVKYEYFDDSKGMNSDTPGIFESFEFKGFIIEYYRPLYIKKPLVSDIIIKEKNISLSVGKKNITVGDDIKKIKEILPYRYELFIKEHPEIKVDKEYRIVGGNLTYGGLEPTNILFWIKNNKITEISIGFPEP